MNKKPYSLTDDTFFKIYFREDTEILKSLLEAFLPLPAGSTIDKVELLNVEQLPARLEGKVYILDLKVRIFRNDQTETVNVEMQTTSEKNFTSRALAYASRIYSQQLGRGDSYKKLAPVYSLIFSTANLPEFKGSKKFYRSFRMRDDESPHQVYGDDLVLVIVELGKFPKSGLKELVDRREAWCYLLNGGSVAGDGEFRQIEKLGAEMGDAVKKLWNLTEEEVLEEVLESERKREWDRLAREADAREEGLEEGLEKGHEEGMKKGVEKGREEGIKRGVEKGREATALKMLRKGIDRETICECTGLSREQIEELAKKT